MLVIIGWVVLVLIAVWFWFATIGGAYCLMGFTGKVSPWLVIPLALAIFFSYQVWDKFPWHMSLVVQ